MQDTNEQCQLLPNQWKIELDDSFALRGNALYNLNIYIEMKNFLSRKHFHMPSYIGLKIRDSDIFINRTVCPGFHRASTTAAVQQVEVLECFSHPSIHSAAPYSLVQDSVLMLDLGDCALQ